MVICVMAKKDEKENPSNKISSKCLTPFFKLLETKLNYGGNNIAKNEDMENTPASTPQECPDCGGSGSVG